MERTFVRIGLASEVPAGAMKKFVVDGTPIAVYNCAGVFTATSDVCTHAEAYLTEGALSCEQGFVECPLHGARFDVRTGKALSLPAVTGVRVYPVKVEDGALWIAT